MNNDLDQLRLLSIFHYILGGIGVLFSCFPIIYLIMGIVILAGGFSGEGGEEIPMAFGLLFVVIPAFFILIGWTLSACIIFAGRKLQLRQSYQFCFMVACVECIVVPFGTILGVFTIIVLNRDSVRELFAPSQGVSVN